MSDELNKLQQLVKVINTGNDFYAHASERIDDPELHQFLDDNIATRNRALERLQPLLVQRQGLAEQGRDVATRLEEERAALSAVLNTKAAATYLDHLENVEAKTGQALREALTAAESHDVSTALTALQTDFDQTRDRMRAAQEATIQSRMAKVGITEIHQVDRAGARSGRYSSKLS